MGLRLFVAMVCIVGLTGCATTQKATPTNQLQIRIAEIEHQMEERDRDVDELKYAVERLANNVEEMTSAAESMGRSSRTVTKSSSKSASSNMEDIIRVSATPRQVQTALKSAGYYNGNIDGKIGSGSQKAIKDFQKDHGMKADGIIGKKTWAELKGYLE